MRAACETPMRDHVAGFWRLIREGKVRILVDTYLPEGFGGAGHTTSSSFPDEVAKALVAENDRLRALLEEIAEPIQAMQRRADEEGNHLDGAMAVNLANDAYYLREIARRVNGQHLSPSRPSDRAP